MSVTAHTMVGRMMIVVATRSSSPGRGRWRSRRVFRPALVDGFYQGGLVEKNDPTLAVLGISGVVKVSEVNVGDPLVGLLDDPHADVPIFFILPIQSVSDDVVTSFGVQ